MRIIILQQVRASSYQISPGTHSLSTLPANTAGVTLLTVYQAAPSGKRLCHSKNPWDHYISVARWHGRVKAGGTCIWQRWIGTSYSVLLASIHLGWPDDSHTHLYTHKHTLVWPKSNGVSKVLMDVWTSTTRDAADELQGTVITEKSKQSGV